MTSDDGAVDRLTRRNVLRGLGGATAVGLAGCSSQQGGGGGDGGGGGGDGGGGDGGSGSGGVTITYHDRDDQYSDYAKPFNEGHENITVEEEIEPDDARYKSVIAQISAGKAPEVIGLDVVRLGQFASLGALADLSDYVTGLEYYDDVFEPLRKDYVQYDGTTYALPFWLDLSMYQYNKKHFEEAGLDPEKPPQTWEAFMSACQSLKEAGHTPAAVSFDGGLTEFFWYPFAWAAGAEFLNEDKTKTGFDDQGAIDAMQFWVDMSNEGLTTDLVGSDWNTNHQKFVDGKASIVFGSGFTNSYVRENNEDLFENLGAEMFPKPKGGKQQTFIGGNSIVISKQTAQDQKKFDAAKKFFQWTNTEEGMKGTLSRGGLPGRKRGFELAEDREAEFFPQAKEALGKGHAPPIHPKYEQIVEPVRTAMENAVLGDKSPEEALTTAADKINSTLSG
jgi:multiple sugar transport system substrate-binding protein